MADVIVLGGGIIGSSVAYFLARSGLKVLILERDAHAPKDQTASSSAARATGGFRVQYGTDINVRLSLMAREILLGLGFETGYQPCGYLFLATTVPELASLEQALAVQRGAGLEVSRLVSPSEIASLNPALNLEGVLGGSYCPWDGFIRPLVLRRGFEDVATQHGAVFRYGANAKLEVQAGQVVVRLGNEQLKAAAIVNATGAWAGTLGIDIPVTPEKRQIAETTPTTVLPPEMGGFCCFVPALCAQTPLLICRPIWTGQRLCCKKPRPECQPCVAWKWLGCGQVCTRIPPTNTRFLGDIPSLITCTWWLARVDMAPCTALLLEN
jgi:sarcosine oxidase, subunit beta